MSEDYADEKQRTDPLGPITFEDGALLIAKSILTT
jgi:hypothetical protein